MTDKDFLKSDALGYKHGLTAGRGKNNYNPGKSKDLDAYHAGYANAMAGARRDKLGENAPNHRVNAAEDTAFNLADRHAKGYKNLAHKQSSKGR